MSALLTFTNSIDVGHAFKPILSPHVVHATSLVAVGYCVADVAWESYKLHQRGYVSEHTQKPLSMSQLIVERSIFQAIATIIVPSFIMHTTVETAILMTRKYGRYQKYGPTIAGLFVIPFLPLCLDEPIERALDYSFARWGPWASSSSSKSHAN